MELADIISMVQHVQDSLMDAVERLYRLEAALETARATPLPAPPPDTAPRGCQGPWAW